MLTKSDLAAIQKMFDVSRKETDMKFEAMDKKFTGKFQAIDKKFTDRFESIDKRFEGIDKKFESIDKRFEEMDKKFTSKFDVLLDRIDKNTGELVELITGGFNSYEERFGRLEKEVFKSN